jgi:hypothetical protein
MTTNTNKDVAPVRDVYDRALVVLSDFAQRIALSLRSAHMRRRAQVHIDRVPAGTEIADERIRQLDAAVECGDVTAEDVRSLREGYERVRSGERAGLPPVDLTY